MKPMLFILNWIKNNSPWKLLQIYYHKKHYNKQPYDMVNYKQSSSFEIYTIAFNNAKLIEKQILLCKKNINDDFLHIIVDNSSNQEAANQIRSICVKHNIMYIRLPKNHLFSSHSHALALNYTWENIIRKRVCNYFWFLDHDIFPIKKTSILPLIKSQKLYWIISDNKRYMKGRWILRPGFCFFDKNVSKTFDFSVVKHIFPFYALDTGWGNYKHIYAKLDKKSLKSTNVSIINKWWYMYDLAKNGEWIHANGASYKKISHDFFDMLW